MISRMIAVSGNRHRIFCKGLLEATRNERPAQACAGAFKALEARLPQSKGRSREKSDIPAYQPRKECRPASASSSAEDVL
jgi:hypothetical protein